MIDKVKNFVEAECKKPASKYGYEPFVHHFKPTVDYASALADKLTADKEVVIISAWLHDIGSIMYGRENHHLTSADVAEKFLRKLKYPKNKIGLVKKCILNHRGSVKNKRISLEEKIIADADGMSHFDNIPGIFKAAFIYENLDQGEAKTSVRNKLKNTWNKLNFEQSKKLIEPRYKAAMLLLK